MHLVKKVIKDQLTEVDWVDSQRNIIDGQIKTIQEQSQDIEKQTQKIAKLLSE